MASIKFLEPMQIPRVTHNDLEPRRGKGGKYYIGKTSRLKEAEASWEAHLAKYTPNDPLRGPVLLRIEFAFWSDTHPRYAPMSQKPDGDNLLKVVQDVMGRLGWFEVGDQQIVKAVISKVWAAYEGVYVELEEVDDGQRV